MLGVYEEFLTPPDYCWFVVWYPAYTMPREHLCFDALPNNQNTSTTVSTPTGTVQMTRVPYDKPYADKLEECVTDFWFHAYIPALWSQMQGDDVIDLEF